ncbi:MAG: phosphate acyltransferase, partial [Candidatus Omnitrophota bacterium]
MNAIEKIRKRAAAKIKTIVLPEYEDPRTLEAVEIVRKESLANVIVLTPDMIDKNLKEKYIQQYYELYQSKDIDLETVKKLFSDNLYYAAMMT